MTEASDLAWQRVGNAVLSVVIPVYNEAENLVPLYEDVTDALLGLQEPFEILFVDDGSSDRSPEILRELAAKEDSIKVIYFRRNFGQTAAMMAGIDYASGEVIIVMDGDGQNDPAPRATTWSRAGGRSGAMIAGGSGSRASRTVSSPGPRAYTCTTTAVRSKPTGAT